MSDITAPDLLERDPTVIVYSLLNDQWDETTISGRFETDSNGRPKWCHTGWYDRSGLPQISVTPRDEGPPATSVTGYTGIDAAGNGPTAQIDGQIDVNVWVPHDSQPYETTGVNPKLLAWELRREVERIIGANAGGTTYNGARELQSLGTGRVETPPEPEETEVENRFLIPVYYTYFRGRLPSDS